MAGVSSVDAHETPGAVHDVHPDDVQAVDADARDVTARSAGDEAPDPAASAPDTDEAVALVATELRLRLGAVAASARDDAGQAKAATTLRASRAAWADCTAWCDRYALPPFPAAPETVTLYLAALADGGRKASTLQRRLSAISQAHQAAGHPAPTRDNVVVRLT